LSSDVVRFDRLNDRFHFIPHPELVEGSLHSFPELPAWECGEAEALRLAVTAGIIAPGDKSPG